MIVSNALVTVKKIAGMKFCIPHWATHQVLDLQVRRAKVESRWQEGVVEPMLEHKVCHHVDDECGGLRQEEPDSRYRDPHGGPHPPCHTKGT